MENRVYAQILAFLALLFSEEKKTVQVSKVSKQDVISGSPTLGQLTHFMEIVQLCKCYNRGYLELDSVLYLHVQSGQARG
jgi:hypothetical protein